MGGSLAMIAFYPLDFLRTRMHIQQQGSSRHVDSLRSARDIIQQDGFRGVYKGMSVSVLSHSLGWGAYLLFFRSAQSSMEKHLGTKDASTKDFASACVAAMFTGALVTPLHVIKTRRQLHDKRYVANNPEELASFRSIIERDGAKALFRGIGPQILLTGNTTIQVTLYEWMRRRFWHPEDPNPWQVAVASGVSKVVSCVLFNPLEVVRTRLQARSNQHSPEYRSMSAGLHHIWQTEGLRGMYRGLPVSVIRVVPSTMVAFVLYEKFLLLLRTGRGAAVGRRERHSAAATHQTMIVRDMNPEPAGN